MNNISKRLKTIANVVSGERIADVGCDHGKLACYLLENNIAKFAYVSDISQSSLDKAKKLLSTKKLPYKAICTNGLIGYHGECVDECIISGMGGSEIIKIISNSSIKVNSFILSPQHNIIEVKKYMIKNGYEITYDKIIKDGGKFYNIFKCQKVNKPQATLVDFDLYFGKENFLDYSIDFIEYLECLKAKNDELLDKVSIDKKLEINKMLKYIDIAEKRIGK